MRILPTTPHEDRARRDSGLGCVCEGKWDDAVKEMRAAADLQDKVGRRSGYTGARDAGRYAARIRPAAEALVEYEAALKLSPNRFNASTMRSCGGGSGRQGKSAAVFGALAVDDNGRIQRGRSSNMRRVYFFGAGGG